ncbi:MAG: ABC transporter substrate-binding protein, partial [Armatimonadota bacterium]|nr:ABC transporter substrate-binding protein [Armatimonadota bacterium]
PAPALKVPVVADFTGPFFEKVVAERPDLIIAQGETWDKARIEAWQQKCGTPVAALTAGTVARVVQSIEKVGAWLDKSDKARQIAQPLRRWAQTPAWSPVERPPLRAFFEVSRAPLLTAGQGTLIDDVIHKAGLANIANPPRNVPGEIYVAGGEIKGYKLYNLEALTAKEPDAYIVAEKNPNQARVLRDLRRHAALGRLKCIREGHVIVLHADWVLRPGPRLQQGLQELHGEAWRMAKVSKNRS